MLVSCTLAGVCFCMTIIAQLFDRDLKLGGDLFASSLAVKLKSDFLLYQSGAATVGACFLSGWSVHITSAGAGNAVAAENFFSIKS